MDNLTHYTPTQIAEIPVIPPHEKYCKTSFCKCIALQEMHGETGKDCVFYRKELDWQKLPSKDGSIFYAAIRLPECLAAERAAKERPKIITLCGSTRFYEAFQKAYYELTMRGWIVLSVGFYQHSSKKAHGEHIGATPEQKVALDELHKRKIDLSNRVHVLNIGGYIGESTRSEIEYAQKLGIEITYEERQP